MDADIALFFSEMKKALPIEAQNLIDGSPIFKCDRDKPYIALQAADLLAWHLRSEHATGVARPLTKTLLNKDGHLVGEIPDEMLRKWAEHDKKMPGIALTQSKGQWRDFKAENPASSRRRH